MFVLACIYRSWQGWEWSVAWWVAGVPHRHIDWRPRRVTVQLLFIVFVDMFCRLHDCLQFNGCIVIFMKHILQWVSYYKKRTYLKFSTQPDIFTLTFWSLPETFVRRGLVSSSSGSCQGSDATWQEIGRTCGSVCSCPRPGSRIAILLSEYVLPLWSI